MIFFMQTFGCKTNQYEAQAIREELLATGHRETEEITRAAIIIINTCTVTGRADATWRNAVAKAHRENPAGRIILCGCAVNVNDTLKDDFPVEAVFRNQEKGLIAAYFANDAATLPPGGETLPAENPAGREDSPADNFLLHIHGFAGHTRAFLKIQDGCDNRCSYCIIPFARGAGRSRPAEEILTEARTLVAAGYREIVLTGINIGAYRYENFRLAELVRALAAVPGLNRLRLGSVEPQEVTDALLAAMAECPNVCPHLHLPLQSGSAEILRRMNRKYTLGEFMAVLEKIRSALPRPAVTTDIITGFPGETDAQAAETLQTVQAARFARSHIFLFSPRAGTPAAAMKPTHPQLVDDRRRELTRVCDETAARYAESLVGTVETVIWETNAPGGFWEGYGERYLRVGVPATAATLPPALTPVKITAHNGSELQGEIVR